MGKGIYYQYYCAWATRLRHERLTTTMRKGRAFVGIIEDDCHGIVSGCIELTDVWSEGAQRVRELDNVERVGEESLNQTWKQIQGGARVQCQERGTRRSPAFGPHGTAEA